MSKFTELPWSVEVMGHTMRVISGVAAFGDDVCIIGDCTKEENQANAALIAQACNGHHDLLDALEAFSSAVWLDPRLPLDMREQLKAVYHNQVLPALEKAK